MSDERYTTRWMIRRDRPTVLSIEQQCFEWPWGEQDFIRCLQQRNCIGIVVYDKPTVLSEEIVVGFMVYELYETRFHLLDIAVELYSRRRGVGRCMIDKLVGKLLPNGRCEITTEVRSTNIEARAFFAASGFREVGVLKNFYDHSNEDAHALSLDVDRQTDD